MYANEMTSDQRLATSDGFTVVELLVSLTIFSLVAVVIYSSFYLGIRTWRKNEASLDTYQMVDFCFNKMRRDFGKIIGRDFSGSENEMSFSIAGMTNVKYFVHHDAPVLIRNERRATSDERLATEMELLQDADGIRFSYEWTEEKNLPRYVKVDFKGYSRVFFIPIDQSNDTAK